MSRGLASAITDELASGQFSMAHLVSLELADPWLFTDAPCDVIDPNTQLLLYYFNLTSGSTAATVSTRAWYGPDVIPWLHSQLVSGMTLTSGGNLKAGTTIASIGASPNITLSLTADTTDATAQTFVSGGFLYIANGFLFGLDSVNESSNLNIGSLNIGISSVNQSVISDVLNNGHLNKEVKIKRIFLDSNYTPISGTSFSIYSGRIEGMSIKESGEDSMMELSVANHWVDFKRESGRQTNNTSQQHHFDGDLSMEFAPQTGKKLLWGEVSTEQAIQFGF